MLPNLPANRLHIRRKSATSHHAGMKITIGTLRLAERHLHVNPNLPHYPKTLAHPASNPATGQLSTEASSLTIAQAPSYSPTLRRGTGRSHRPVPLSTT